MSIKLQYDQITQLFAGRWQIPLALIAAGAAATTLLRLAPSTQQPSFDALLADVTVLERAGDTLAAADAVANLLDMEADSGWPPAQQARLHDRLAGLIFKAEQRLDAHDPGNLRNLLEHQQAARELGRADSAIATMRMAYAHQWLGEEDTALKHFQDALDQGLPSPEQRAASMALIDLLGNRPESRQQRQRALECLMADEGVSPAYLWWALHRSVTDALDEGDTPRARQLLTTHGEQLKSSDLRGYLEFLWACVKLHEGRTEEAVPLVHWIDGWLGDETRSTSELDDFGHLPSLNRWLMGRVHLEEGRPQEALQAFEDALAYGPRADLQIAASAGRGVALGTLERHAEALGAFRQALGELSLSPSRQRRAIAEFQRSLLDLFNDVSDRGNDAAALAYLSLAAELTPRDQAVRRLELYEQLGRAYQTATRAAADAETVRAYHEQAARAFEQAAELAFFDEPRLTAFLWSAAEEYDLGGRISDQRQMLLRFVSGRSEHPLMPQARLRLGRTYEASGDPDSALNWYNLVIADFPRLEEAARAKVLSAGVLLSMGPERYADAERILSDLLTEGTVKPDAGEFRDALLTLCDLLTNQGRHAEAISRLHDFLILYPDDTERLRARFALANAQRLSGYALRDDPPTDAAPAAVAAKSRERFEQAAVQFGELLTDLDAVDDQDEAQQLYTELALLYRADCLYELNEPDTLRAALAIYQNVAARYDSRPAALTAHVQMANVLLRQGDAAAAARTLERADWLLRSMPDEAYAQSNGGSRADWERLVSTMLSTELLKDASGDTP